MAVQVYIGLGSNLKDPQHQLRTAISEMQLLADDAQVTASPIYITRPVGPQDQPDYYNAAVRLTTELDAHALLEQLQKIENSHQRQRSSEQWGPRTLDLDLLVYGNEVINSDVLTVPHPRIQERAFVLKPLSDLDPHLTIPGQGVVSDLLASTDQQGIKQQLTHHDS